MTGFSATQIKRLAGRLDRRHVQSRKVDERAIDYIEGWFAIAEANAIFGFGGWDREMTHFERAFERTRGEATTCAYIARVRIIVRAGSGNVVREGTGWGAATSKHPSDAHERALKVAETDATKRALATFGNRFGLGLYDRDQAGVTPKPEQRFAIKDPGGTVMAADLSPEGFCSGLRRIVETAAIPQELEGWLKENRPQILELKEKAPALKNAKGEHFADLLERLFQAKLARASDSQTRSEKPMAPRVTGPAAYPLKPSKIGTTRIDKSALTIGTTRRLRDKEHLRHVGSLPCLVCQTVPSHSHHLTFAQPRGLSLKVSDEFVVPLCAVHHNEIHRAGAEELWWKRAGIEPMAVAQELWDKRTAALDSAIATVAATSPPN